jgi:hypothetical protein
VGGCSPPSARSTAQKARANFRPMPDMAGSVARSSALHRGKARRAGVASVGQGRASVLCASESGTRITAGPAAARTCRPEARRSRGCGSAPIGPRTYSGTRGRWAGPTAAVPATVPPPVRG